MRTEEVEHYHKISVGAMFIPLLITEDLTIYIYSQTCPLVHTLQRNVSVFSVVISFRV